MPSPGRSDLTKQNDLRHAYAQSQLERDPAAQSDVVAAVQALGVKIDATNTALAALGVKLDALATKLDTIATNTTEPISVVL